MFLLFRISVPSISIKIQKPIRVPSDPISDIFCTGMNLKLLEENMCSPQWCLESRSSFHTKFVSGEGESGMGVGRGRGGGEGGEGTASSDETRQGDGQHSPLYQTVTGCPVRSATKFCLLWFGSPNIYGLLCLTSRKSGRIGLAHGQQEGFYKSKSIECSHWPYGSSCIVVLMQKST